METSAAIATSPMKLEERSSHTERDRDHDGDADLPTVWPSPTRRRPTRPLPGLPARRGTGRTPPTNASRTFARKQGTLPPCSPRPRPTTHAIRGRTPYPSPGSTVRYFGDYEVQAELGRGGMGVVYRARQVSLNRPVALKMIRAGVLAGDDELRRFRNEAEAVALLDHPGIVPVYEVGEHDGQRYFSMKLVPGRQPRRPPRGLPRRPAGRRDAAGRGGRGGAPRPHAGHPPPRPQAGQHPGRRRRASPHVTDFGLAKRVEGDAELTATGAILGTPAYMAPEQALGRRGAITTATDVYGLGAVLYALLTGRAPFGGDSVVDTLDQGQGAAPRAAPQAQREGAAGPGGDLPEVPGEGPAAAVRQRPGAGRRPAGLAGGPADRGAAGGCAGAGGEVVRRHRSVVTTAALVLVLGAVVSTWQAIRATRAEGLAGTGSKR